MESVKVEETVADPVVEPAKDKPNDSAADKYGIGDKYIDISASQIASRYDYENMSIAELQVAILEKMAKNGPVNDQMIKTVMDNEHMGSLLNWVRSFN